MSNGNFRRALLDVDRELARVPYSGERDLRKVVAARRGIPWRLPALALAAAVAFLLITRARDREPAHVAGFSIVAPQSSWQTRGDTLEVLAPDLDVDVPGFGHMVADRGARVARIDGGIHVLQGRIEVAVTHRPAGLAPALVQVSDGTIAVLGTRFTIEQFEEGGRVVLHEGRIRFDSGERSVVLTAGSSLRWPLAPVESTPPASVALAPRAIVPVAIAPDATAVALPAATPPAATPPAATPPAATPPAATPPAATPPAATPPAATPPAATPPAATARDDRRVSTAANKPVVEPAPTASSPELDVDHVLAQLANLRARRRFADAAALLERALTTGLSTTTQDRLSYELGDILTYQLADPERACRHWQSHHARFPNSRYADEVAAAERRLNCEGTPP